MTHREFLDLQPLEPLAKLHYETHQALIKSRVPPIPWAKLSTSQRDMYLMCMHAVLERLKRNAPK